MFVRPIGKARAVAWSLIFGTSLLVVEAPAKAQSSPTSTVAEDLFHRGKEKMYAKAFAEACPLLAESYRLAPAGGTLQNLAICYEETGKWASAYVSFQSLKAMSSGDRPRPERVALAQEHLATLGPRVSRTRVRLPATVQSVEVTIDGVRLSDAVLAAGIPVDPGKHELVAQASGRTTYKTTFEVPVAGKELDLVIPELAQSKSSATADALQRAANRVPAFVVGGVGVGLLAASGVFGFLTLQANAKGKDLCTVSRNGSAPRSDFSASGRCLEGSGALASANEEKDKARTYGTVSGVLAPIGLVGVALGIYWLTRSPQVEAPNKTSIRVSPTLGGGLIEGTF